MTLEESARAKDLLFCWQVFHKSPKNLPFTEEWKRLVQGKEFLTLERAPFLHVLLELNAQFLGLNSPEY